MDATPPSRTSSVPRLLDGQSQGSPVTTHPRRPSPGCGAERKRLAALEALFAPGEVETVVDRSGVSGCGAHGRRAVTVRHRPTGREVAVATEGTQVANKIAALRTLLKQLGRDAEAASEWAAGGR
jgi:hypothetical protein